MAIEGISSLRVTPDVDPWRLALQIRKESFFGVAYQNESIEYISSRSCTETISDTRSIRPLIDLAYQSRINLLNTERFTYVLKKPHNLTLEEAFNENGRK